MSVPSLDFSSAITGVAAIRREELFPPGILATAERLADQTIAVLFPQLAMDGGSNLEVQVSDLATQFRSILVELRAHDFLSDEQDESLICTSFVNSLPEIGRALLLDAEATFDGDPAACSVEEVILYYPGFMAIALYRVAHQLDRLSVPLLPRIISGLAHRRTGVDIHPSASIGRKFSIDHGTGIVIGATAVIGDGVKLYQGVTLGALNVQKSLARTKRHPTVEDNVVIYANATILGGETTIGHDTIVGGNAFITESVPPFSFATRSADIRSRKAGEGSDLEFYI